MTEQTPKRRIWMPIKLPLSATYQDRSARAQTLVWELWAAINRHDSLRAHVGELKSKAVGSECRPKTLQSLLFELESAGLFRVEGGLIDLCRSEHGYPLEERTDHFAPKKKTPPKPDPEPQSGRDYAAEATQSGRDDAAVVSQSGRDDAAVVSRLCRDVTHDSSDSRELGPESGSTKVHRKVHINHLLTEVEGGARAREAPPPPPPTTPKRAGPDPPPPARGLDDVFGVPENSPVTAEVWADYQGVLHQANEVGHRFAVALATAGNLHRAMVNYPNVDHAAVRIRMASELTSKLAPKEGSKGMNGDGISHYLRLCSYAEHDGPKAGRGQGGSLRGSAGARPGQGLVERGQGHIFATHLDVEVTDDEQRRIDEMFNIQRGSG